MANDVQFVYKPKTGEVPMSTGPMKAGVPVTFGWRTPASGVHAKGANGRLQMVAPPGSNVTLTGTFVGIKRSGTGQTSFNWAFGEGHGQVPMDDDTEYAGQITAEADCAGVTLKLTAR